MAKAKPAKGAGGGGGGGGGFLARASGRGTGLAALPQRAAEELEALQAELGGRQALVTALTYAPQSRDLRYALGLLADPAHADMPLADICRLGHLLPGALVDALAKGMELRARLLATQRITRQLPAVVADVMEKAAPYEDDCPRCQGLGHTTPDPTPQTPNPSPEPCTHCLGAGRLRFDADSECRALALEMGGLVGKGGGIHLTQQLALGVVGGGLHGNIGGGGGGGSLERMQEALDDLLYGQAGAEGEPTETLEGEVLSRATGETSPTSAESETPGGHS